MPNIQTFCKNQDPTIPYFHYKLTASSSVNGPFTWSNGATGSTIIFPHGGLVSVSVAIGNCTATTTLNLPKDPEKFLWSYPAGCLTLCDIVRPVQFPFILGPLASFQSWTHQLPFATENGSDIPNTINIISGNAGTYNFALTNSGCTAFAEPLSITLINCDSFRDTKMANQDTEQKITMYPNPATTQVTINGLAADSIIEIYDLLGKIQNIPILEKNDNTQVLNTQALAKGVYIVLIEEPNGNKSQYKLIIN
jgi:hypothetical protein